MGGISLFDVAEIFEIVIVSFHFGSIDSLDVYLLFVSQYAENHSSSKVDLTERYVSSASIRVFSVHAPPFLFLIGLPL